MISMPEPEINKLDDSILWQDRCLGEQGYSRGEKERDVNVLHVTFVGGCCY
jgi:hypothetical protein